MVHGATDGAGAGHDALQRGVQEYEASMPIAPLTSQQGATDSAMLQGCSWRVDAPRPGQIRRAHSDPAVGNSGSHRALVVAAGIAASLRVGP